MTEPHMEFYETERLKVKYLNRCVLSEYRLLSLAASLIILVIMAGVFMTKPPLTYALIACGTATWVSRNRIVKNRLRPRIRATCDYISFVYLYESIIEIGNGKLPHPDFREYVSCGGVVGFGILYPVIKEDWISEMESTVDQFLYERRWKDQPLDASKSVRELGYWFRANASWMELGSKPYSSLV